MSGRPGPGTPTMPAGGGHPLLELAGPHPPGTPRHTERSGYERSRRRLALGLLCGAAGLSILAGQAMTGRFNNLPLLNPAIADCVEALAAAALVGSWACWRRHWLTRTLPLIVAAATALTAAAAAVLRLSGTVTDPYPPSFALWVGMAIAATVALPVIVRRAGAARGFLAGSAVPLAMVGALLLVNDEYGVWPTLGVLLDHTAMLGPSVLSARPVTPRHGILVAIDPPAMKSRFHHRPGSVYLPPAYFTAARADLPVIIMLAGTPGSTVQWPTAGDAVGTADAYEAAHHGLAPVLVFVDHNGSSTRDTECADGPQGNAETYLTVDVPAFVTRTLRLPHDPDRWAVGGFSEGGTCALDLVLAHPMLFRHLVDLGGDAEPTLGSAAHTLAALFGGSARTEYAHSPQRLLATHSYRGLTAWFGVGVGDPSRIPVAQKLARAAATAGIRTSDITATGGHNWQFASAAFAQIMPPLCTQLGLPGP